MGVFLLRHIVKERNLTSRHNLKSAHPINRPHNMVRRASIHQLQQQRIVGESGETGALQIELAFPPTRVAPELHPARMVESCVACIVKDQEWPFETRLDHRAVECSVHVYATCVSGVG